MRDITIPLAPFPFRLDMEEYFICSSRDGKSVKKIQKAHFAD